MKEIITAFHDIGLGEIETKTYLAALALGEGTIQQIAREAKQKRTSVYYTVEKLLAMGMLLQVRQGKKIYLVPEKPGRLASLIRQRAVRIEHILPKLESLQHETMHRPQISYFYGPTGFKQLWDRILVPETKEYRITTSAENFTEFVREKYILKKIISLKKKNKIFSYHLIADSPLARSIIVKDKLENRVSKLLPPRFKLPFTEIITDQFVAFISPRRENILMIIESPSLAKTRYAIFEALWAALPDLK
jgi:sugar-specific transcriptional regulator TrmB